MIVLLDKKKKAFVPDSCFWIQSKCLELQQLCCAHEAVIRGAGGWWCGELLCKGWLGGEASAYLPPDFLK